MPTNQVMKSYTALAVSGGILENVVKALQSAKATAVSKGETQVVDVYFRGHRHDMVWGKILVIPASVCEGDFSNIPKPLLDGAMLKTFHGEDLADFETYRLSDSEFDTPSSAQIKQFKEALFPKSENGRFSPIIMFLPAWSNPKDYSIVKWTSDEEELKAQLCGLCFHVYYNPAFSNLYDELITLEDKLDLCHLKDNMGLSVAFQQGPDAEHGTLEKRSSLTRPRMLITAANMNEVMGELSSDEPVLDQGEVDVFDEVGKQVSSSKKLALTMFTPGQALREFYPELNDGLLKYPAQNNSGMPEATQDTSADAGPASGSLNPKPSFLEESVPLRQEMALRGPGAMDQFYRSVTNIPGFRLNMASVTKQAASTPDNRVALLEVLQGVCGEIAGTFIAAYRMTSKPLAMGIPGEGTINLSCVGGVELGSQLKGLIRGMNDGDLQGILNDSWAQGSVWCNGEQRGFTYEVLVRAESFDDDTLELKYKFITNLK